MFKISDCQIQYLNEWFRKEKEYSAGVVTRAEAWYGKAAALEAELSRQKHATTMCKGTQTHATTLSDRT